MNTVSHLKIDLSIFEELITSRLSTLVEFLTANGADELDAINFILDMAELLLDEFPLTLSEIQKEISHANR